MKKLLSVSLATLAFAAVAEYQPITVGVTTITPTTQDTIIPVPYTTIGSSTDVSVHDLVKAANLPNNTMLYYFDGTNYKAWKKNSSGAWSTPDISATIGSAAVSAGSTEIHVAVGAALWVSFPSGTTLNEQSVVVYGSPAATTNSTVNLGQVNLLCNPSTSTVTGEALATKLSFAEKGDRIRLIAADFSGEYVKAASGWKQNTGTGYVNTTLPSIASYQGFWYIPKTRSGTAEINW